MLIGINAEGVDVLAAVSSLAIFPITAWLIALGLWIYKEDAELVG